MSGRACGDCAAKPGELHSEGCDVARCLVTGYQRLACDREHPGGCGRQVWTGEWPGVAECEIWGFWTEESEAVKARFRELGLPVPEGPRHDLNRLIGSWECDWDTAARYWRKRGTPDDDTAYVRWHLDRGLQVPPGRYRCDGVPLVVADAL